MNTRNRSARTLASGALILTGGLLAVTGWWRWARYLLGIRTEEMPDYRLLNHDGPIEIRAYEPALCAEVEIGDGESYENAMRNAFKILAGYIFGKNQARQKMAMTAPVIEQREDKGWSMRFFVPKGIQREALPAPSDSRVRLVQLPSRKMLVLRFSGAPDEKEFERRTEELKSWAAKNRLPTESGPIFALYDPPFTIPFLRRNEVMLVQTG